MNEQVSPAGRRLIRKVERVRRLLDEKRLRLLPQRYRDMKASTVVSDLLNDARMPDSAQEILLEIRDWIKKEYRLGARVLLQGVTLRVVFEEKLAKKMHR